MRTETDLRAALSQRADQAPEPSLGLIEHALAGPARPRLRAGLSIGAAVVTAAALIAVPVALSAHPGAGRAPAAASSQRAATPAVLSPMSWATVSLENPVHRDMLNDLELLTIQLSGGGRIQVVDFAPKAFDPGAIIDPTPVTVDGHAGYFGQISSTPNSAAHWPATTTLGNPRPSLAWPVGNDRWVVLAGDSAEFKTEAGLLAITPKLGVQVRSTPVLMPIKLGYLPAGWTLQTAALSGTGPHLRDSGYTRLGLADGKGHSLSISMLPHVGAPIDAALTRTSRGYDISLSASGSGLSQASLHRILNSATVAAAPGNENHSWFPISSVLP